MGLGGESDEGKGSYWTSQGCERGMIRAYAIGLSVGAVRPIGGVFFATSRLTQLAPRDFFGIAFWLSFVLSFATAEAWIRRTSS